MSPNSDSSLKIILNALSAQGFRAVERSVSSTGEVLVAAQSLVGACDFMYMPADNTVLSSLPAVVSVANSRRIPLFVGDEGSVELGAALTVGVDYYDLGKLTGNIAVRILQGESPGNIPVAFTPVRQLVINSAAAQKQGLVVPADLLSRARFVGK